MNLTRLDRIIDESVVKKLDHNHLNLDVPEFKNLNTTAENIAVVIWNALDSSLPKGLLFEVPQTVFEKDPW